MFEIKYYQHARITVGRQYFFGKGWKWKLKIGKSRFSGLAETKWEAEIDAKYKKYQMQDEWS